MRLRSLKAHLALSFGSITLVLTIMLGVIIGETSSRQVERDIGQSLAELAFQMSDTLDRGMFERYRDIQIVATLDSMRDPRTSAADRRALLEKLQSTYQDYAWIGFVDRRGKVQASTGTLLEGVDVSQRPWFLHGLDGPFVGDVREARLLAKLLPNPKGEPIRFVDVAVPVTTRQGTLLGVVAAHLSWTWAQEVERSVLEPVAEHSQIELLVESHDGIILLGPSTLPEQTPNLASVQEAQRGENGYVVEQWPDGKSYLTGFSYSHGYRAYAGLGWIILARQDVNLAFTPVKHLQLQILLCGSLISLAFIGIGWIMASGIAHPLLALTQAAEQIRRGDMAVQLPVVPSYREANVLSRSLNELISTLIQRKAELKALNESLEQRVQTRTEELLRINEELTKEIHERQRAEQERERLIMQLQQLAETDALTGIYNRRAFFTLAEREFKRIQRMGEPCSIVMLDIDRFKQINDTYGHAIGDQVLKGIARCCQTLAREIDILGRYGGEEFVLLVQEANAELARHVAERLRIGIMQLRFPTSSADLTVTASFGVAETNDSITDLTALINYADAALYEAKRSGRNRVVVSDMMLASQPTVQVLHR